MASKIFEDTSGKIWIVTRTGSTIKVRGHRDVKVSLYVIARDCAQKLGVTRTRSGIPLEFINEHRRIWNTIWDKGRST
jgi:acyl-coenzyme A synthetase/AMP-(fatty) acid ligase